MSRCLKETPTKERILEVAERLFAEKGLDGTSMREITDAAGVNLASVNYHFGSKDGLISEVFRRHFAPLNEERMALLDAVEAAAGDRPPTLEAVLDAFIRPAVIGEFMSNLGKSAFLLLMGRCLCEPATYVEKYLRPHFGPTMERFDSMIARLLPGLAREEIFWKMNFTIGAVHHVLPIWSNMAHLPFGPEKPPDSEGIIRRLISFALAGMRSPVVIQD